MSEENVFDSKAVTWDEKPQRIEFAKKAVAAIKSAAKVDKGTRVMEFGCGTGLVSILLSGDVKHITAVDNSRGMLDVLDKKLQENGIENIRTKFIDLTKDMLVGEKFDVIISCMAFHHIEDHGGVLAKFYELLNAGGEVVIIDLEKEDGSFHGGNKVFHNGFDRGELSDILTQTGFSGVSSSIAETIEREDPAGNIGQYPVFLMKAVKQ